MRGIRNFFHKRNEEHGATAVIVTLSLVALLGLIVLTVDVGQLLFKRRSMVNASDAAALAAAQSCAGLDDADSPEAMADAFAVDNATQVITGLANIVDIAGCDGPAFGHVTVEYASNQDLFFAGVLGFDGTATVKTQATAGWGPTGAANPLPIVVYTGQEQGNCDIEPGTAPGTSCYLWYDNDLFNNSAFGFLNLCTATDPCQQGWDVSAGDTCPNVGASLREDWIQGNWSGGPNEVTPPATLVCRVSGISESNWTSLEGREMPGGHVFGENDSADLIFPVNDCTQQILEDGTVGCSDTIAPEKYAIVGFIVLHLEDVLDSASEWGGTSLTSCRQNNLNVTTGQRIPLEDLGPSGQCPTTDPSGVENFTIDNQTSGANWSYDATNEELLWTGPNDRVEIEFDWWLDGQCGRPPNNSSAICIQVTTVEVRFGGTDVCETCPDFGLRAVRLCDLAYNSCPQDPN
jgi:Flp pilus assembly protein TadG